MRSLHTYIESEIWLCLKNKYVQWFDTQWIERTKRYALAGLGENLTLRMSPDRE